MSASIKTMQDKNGNQVHPRTRVQAVYDNSNNTLDTLLTNKQDKTDNALNTTSKNIVGAINELDSAIDSKQNTISDIATIRSNATLGSTAIQSSQKGANNGVAELDSNGKVPSTQLPSYVDDVLEYAAKSSFPATGETGKIYIAQDTNVTYRWSGSAYVEISSSLALGETSSTAYRGDRGKTAYDHSQDSTAHVTSSDKSTWNSKQSALSTAQLNACNSGITSGKVSTYDGYANTISGKESTSNKVTSMTAQSTDTQYPSAKCVYDEISQLNEDIADKEDTDNKVTSWTATTTNTHYPSEKLVKDSLDAKVDKVLNAVSGNFASFNNEGGVVDSGKKLSDFGTYSKPVNGIPEGDLAINVQSKLDDVDTLMTTAPIIPVTAKSEMSDHSKNYLLNGHIWRWETRTITHEITVTVPAKACIILGKRYSHGSATFVDADNTDCLIIPIESSGTSDIINIRNKDGVSIFIIRHNSWTGLYYGTTNSLFQNSFTLADNTQIVSATNIALGEQFICFMVPGYGDYSGAGIQVDGVDMNFEISATPTAVHQHTETATVTEEVSDYYDTNIVYGAGKSAYQVAVDNGFVGTESEWLESLRIPANIVQTLGPSTTSVMSQNAVTKALKDVVTDGLEQYIGKVVAPTQKPANSTSESDINLDTESTTSADIDAMLEPIVTRYPNYITRELLGKDASGELNIYRYVLGKHYYSAWCKQNYPKMYGWKNGSTIIYSISVSPRIGDTMYSTSYIGTSVGTVTAMSATNQSRTVGGVIYVRNSDSDIEPTLIYYPIFRQYGLENRLYRLQNGEMYFTATMQSINNTTIVDTNNVTYNRYPFGDLDQNCHHRTPVTIFANEHGGYEPREPALISARLIKDLCENNNPENVVFKYIKDNVSLSVITCVNPYGWNKYNEWFNGYRNANSVNINRNYDTPGWDAYTPAEGESSTDFGAYAGSEIETQYVMNTIAESGAKVAMSIHGIGRTSNSKTTYYQGQNPDGSYNDDKIQMFREDYYNRYGLNFLPYNPLPCSPSNTAKSPSYITHLGAYGGLIEFNSNDAQINEGSANRRYTSWTMEQQYTLLLKFIAMWISDYEDSLVN